MQKEFERLGYSLDVRFEGKVRIEDGAQVTGLSDKQGGDGVLCDPF